MLDVRWVTLALQLPRHQVGRTHREPVEVTALLVSECNAPAGAAALNWLLLATCAVEDVATAWKLATWYRDRWLIERYHYVLKSGCRLEAMPLEHGDRLERALATYSIVAWRVLWTTYEARERGGQPCTVALEEAEWQALAAARNTTANVGTEPPGLREDVRWIA